MYIEKKYCQVLDKAKLVVKQQCQGQNAYETSCIFYGLFIPPKIKYCLTIHGCCIMQQHMTIEGFNDSKRFLDRSQYFDMLEGKKNISYVTKVTDEIV